MCRHLKRLEKKLKFVSKMYLYCNMDLAVRQERLRELYCSYLEAHPHKFHFEHELIGHMDKYTVWCLERSHRSTHCDIFFHVSNIALLFSS